MKQSPKLLAIIVVIALVLIIGLLSSGHHSHSSTTAPVRPSHAAFDVASGDTNNEVLKSIVARQQRLQKENATLMAANKRLTASMQAKQTREIDSLKQTLQQSLRATQAKLLALQHQRQQDSSQAASVKTPSTPSTGRYTVNNFTASHVAPSATGQMVGAVPDLAATLISAVPAAPTAPAPVLSTGKGPVDLPSNHPASSGSLQKLPNPATTASHKAVYTLPDGATVANVSLMSPLIGEVPVSGHLVAPAFPFKAIISANGTEKMFAANGIPLPPGIAGTVLQGYAVGSMALGCTRAYVTKGLFVFDDGHYVVFPGTGGDATSATAVYPHQALGYLSDPYNNACISGQYITDAPKVIASFMALGAGEGAGAAIAQAQTETYTSFSQATTGAVFNGSLGKYAAGLGVNEGAKEALRWYKTRIGDIFDAIFVPSTLKGAPRQLIFNVTHTIQIDFNQQGRVLDGQAESLFATTPDSTLE